GGARASYHDDVVPAIDVLLRLDAKVLVDVEDPAQRSSHAGAVMRAWFDRLGMLLPFEVRRHQVRPRVEIALRPTVVDAADDLHVLLRHRLLPQPESFEGLCMIQEILDEDYLAVPVGQDLRIAEVALRSALRAVHSDAHA